LPGLLAAMSAADVADEVEQAFCLLALVLAVARLDPRDSRLEAVAARLLALESGIATTGYARPEHGFLIGASFHDLRASVWREQIDGALESVATSPAAPQLARLVAKLSSE
jgi:hypothetical protein